MHKKVLQKIGKIKSPRKSQSACEKKDRDVKIIFRTFLRNTILDVMRDRGFLETKEELEWDIHWAHVRWIRQTGSKIRLREHQKINHFMNFYELTRKDLLIKNIRRIKREMERQSNMKEAMKFASICPLTYCLPAEYQRFVNEFQRSGGGIWITKPCGSCQGRGIILVNRLAQIEEQMKDLATHNKFQFMKRSQRIVQKYIERPLLVGGKKFDMRIYALVLSFRPLTVYLYKEGFARFSHSRYTLKNLGSAFIHLTNVAIQKLSKEYDSRGCKWMLRDLRLYLMTKFGEQRTERIFQNIQEIILRSLVSVQKVMVNDKHCFELYGYDVLIDANLKCWILEINASPSLKASTPNDYQFKHNLLMDMLSVIDMEETVRSDVLRKKVEGFELICYGKPNYKQKSSLGTFHRFTHANSKRMKRKKKKKKKVKTQSEESDDGIEEEDRNKNQ